MVAAVGVSDTWDNRTPRGRGRANATHARGVTGVARPTSSPATAAIAGATRGIAIGAPSVRGARHGGGADTAGGTILRLLCLQGAGGSATVIASPWNLQAVIVGEFNESLDAIVHLVADDAAVFYGDHSLM